MTLTEDIRAIVERVNKLGPEWQPVARHLEEALRTAERARVRRLRQDGWLGAALLALALIGCAAGDVAVGAAVTDYALGEVTHEVAHACDCDSTKGPWASCQNGAGLCCRTCGRVCVVLEVKPPVPIPLPPSCDISTHCKTKESCVVGDHECCAACHQACL